MTFIKPSIDSFLLESVHIVLKYLIDFHYNDKEYNYIIHVTNSGRF